jgi:hypothetical protein
VQVQVVAPGARKQQRRIQARRQGVEGVENARGLVGASLIEGLDDIAGMADLLDKSRSRPVCHYNRCAFRGSLVTGAFKKWRESARISSYWPSSSRTISEQAGSAHSHMNGMGMSEP